MDSQGGGEMRVVKDILNWLTAVAAYVLLLVLDHKNIDNPE